MRVLRQVLAMALGLALLVGCATSGNPSASSAAPTSAGSNSDADSLHVFAAASLTAAFQEIGKNFEAAHPGTKLSFNFAGSQQLAQQIAQGAPADVFASANQSQMKNVVASGQVAADSAHTFAHNRLVVIYPQDNPAKLSTLHDLARPGVKLVLAAKEVPVGGYALDFLAKASKLPDYTASYSATVLANVVSYEENVKAVLGKVVLGEADAGIVYRSDVSPNSIDQIGTLDIPDQLNTVADYPIATITGSPHGELAQSFVGYVLS
ncbi:MAG TPA: molybdate ABC transporter substrate-binding protein, partial [Roseiflexaceae bacterium]|nr:molybdate ABC transporter substrate-binding protein [Roseiflexaceae bacterium]